MQPNGLWYGIPMRVSRDEPTTPDNPVKRYAFGWTNSKGKKCCTVFGYAKFDSAVKAADAHRKKHPTNTDYHVVGRAVAGFAF